MSNDDCSALCPKCGHTVLVGTFPDNKGIITRHSVYCSNGNCGWEENWKKDPEFGGFIKQPEPLKIIRKTFVIEYEGVHAENEFTAQNIRVKLNENAYGKFVKVEQRFIPPKIPDLIPEIKEDFPGWIPERDGGDDDIQAVGTTEDYDRIQKLVGKMIKESEIKKNPELMKNNCSNCGWWDMKKFQCNNDILCNDGYNYWKPIEPKIVKECHTCDNHIDCSIKQSNKCVPFNHKYWRPIEKEKEPEIVKSCKNCNGSASYLGWDHDYKRCVICGVNLSEWKPIEKKEEKRNEK